MLKKFLAAFGTLFLAAGLSVIAVAAPASATHPVVSGVAACNPVTGTYDITWTLTGDPAYKDSTATITKQSVATAPTLVGLTVKGAGAQQGVQAGVTPGSYTLKVDVDWGDHTSSNTGNVTIPKLPSCDKPVEPTCIPGSAVTYTYDALLNKGNIHVEAVPGSTGELCKQFWVTATSWKFVNKTGWPQSLDVVDKLGPITKPGDYPYTAPVTCGQGDIYASFTEQPVPPTVLNGPNDPWAEKFLSDMGFKGDTNPTYMVQDAKCQETKPTVSYRLGACYPNGTFSSSNLFLVFDNTASTVPVTFTVPNAPDVKGTDPAAPIVRVVPAGLKVEVETTPIWQDGGSYTVQMSGVPSVTLPDQDITIKPYLGCLTVKPGDPSSTGETCVAGSTKPLGGSITVGFEKGLQYSIDGPGTAYDFVIVNQKTTTGLPAGDYIVRVEAKPGFVLTGATSWPLTVPIKAANCTLTAGLALTGSTTPVVGLGVIGGLLVLAGVGFAVIRKRRSISRHRA